ncbi:MAG: WG repeat-containing protein [Clostridia bacterium]|nr:WG repeat-containing protein [Clostridia bacterium]
MRLFNEIAKRGAAILILAATVFATVTYSLGLYEISFIDRKDEEYDDNTIQEILGTLEPGTNISDFTGDITDITLPPEITNMITTDAPGTTSAPDVTLPPETSADTTASGSQTEPTPAGPTTLAEYLDAGYRITWKDFDPETQLAELVLDFEGMDQYTLGSTKRVIVKMKMDYGEAHREVPYNATLKQTRPALEMYMGYIMVDSGSGDVISGIDDKLYQGASRVSIYSSVGKLIGIYPGDEIIPAYARDIEDRALFIYNGVYYYLNESTGRFEVSDFKPAKHSRGLYFDYNPDFGKSDNKYQIFSTWQEITETYEIHDTSSYYTRYGVDSRLAEQLYLYFPKFATQISYTFDGGKYYNRLFAIQLEKVIKGVESGEITRPPETTVEPETTVTPDETTVPPEETTVIPEETTTIPEETTAVPEETTVVPEETTVIPEETTAIPEETTVIPEETTVIPEETTVIPEETTVIPEETTVIPEETTTTPEETTTTPEETTAVPEETTSVPEETTSEPEVTTHVMTEETTAVPPQARSIIATSPDDKDNNGIPDSITLDYTYEAYRFTYRASQPKVDLTKTVTNKYTYNGYITQTISWKTDFKYAKAYNFSENRAYTVDANGIVKIINTSGNAAVYLYNSYKTESGEGSFWRFQYYTEPFECDEYMLGHYFFEDGLIRMRVVERLPHKLDIYEADYEVLVDTNGKEVSVLPDGYTLVSYSDSVFLVERNGRYGYYHRDGYWVAQPIYTYAAPFIEGLAVLGYEEGIKGVIDTEGNIVIPFQYTSISNASTGLFACFSESDGWKVFAKVKK